MAFISGRPEVAEGGQMVCMEGFMGVMERVLGSIGEGR